MEISKLIVELQNIMLEHGDIEVYLQAYDKKTDDQLANPSFFIVPEEYTSEDGGWAVNLRTWPY